MGVVPLADAPPPWLGVGVGVVGTGLGGFVGFVGFVGVGCRWATTG